MSGGGAEAVIFSDVSREYIDINISDIPSETHLFFDDDPKFISQVNDAVKKYNTAEKTLLPILLQSIPCPTGQLELVDSSSGNQISVKGTADESTTGIKNYSTVKTDAFTSGTNMITTYFSQEKNLAKNNGNGITLGMIQQIIDFETTSEQPKVRKYFFDFDLTLSLVSGLDFGFTRDPDMITSLSLTYAKYLFSNYTGEEPDGARNGRFAKLQEMFTTIGDPSRVYVITGNQNASIQRLKSDGKTFADNPYRKHVVELLRHLFPAFTTEHLICSYSKNPEGQNNKGTIIVRIVENERNPSGKKTLQKLFPNGGMRRTTQRKPKRKSSSSSSSSSKYKRRRYSKKSKK